MSIYEKPSYSQSHGVFLAGPIEWWWHEDRFDSAEAVAYREWREKLSAALAEAGYLVYRPFDAFKGPWNEAFQDVNDHIMKKCTIIIDMTPEGVTALGTDHEVALARKLGKRVMKAPPVVSGWVDMKIRWIVLDVGLAIRNLDRH